MGATAILCIETSSKVRSQIALGQRVSKTANITWSLQHLGPKASQGEQLCTAIKTLLEKNGTEIQDLETIFVSAGPGSYTGIRIGMATALGLALVHNISVVPVGTLLCLGIGASGAMKGRNDTLFLPLVKAQKGQVSGSLYQIHDHQPRALLADSTLNPQEWVKALSAFPQRSVVIFGDGFLAYKMDFLRDLKAANTSYKTFPDSWKYHHPQAQCLAAFGQDGFGKSSHQLFYPRPNHQEFKAS